MEGDPAGRGSPLEGGADPEATLEQEVVQLRSQLERVRRVKARRTRRVATAVLAVLTTISVIASTVAFWAHRTVFDQDHYMEVVAPLGANHAVTGALSTYLSNQIVTALDLKTRIGGALKDIPDLPAAANLLVRPAANALANSADDLIRRRVGEYLASQDFRNLWVEANRVGHAKVVALLRGDYSQLPNVKTGDTEVRLDLLPIVSRMLRLLVQDGVSTIAPGVTVPDVSLKDIPDSARRRLSEALGISLPPNFGEVTLMSKSQLETLQSGVDRFDRLVWGLILLSILLAAATLVVAINKRRALVELAISVVVGLILGGVGIRRVKEAVVDRVKTGQVKGAARAVIDGTLGPLKSIAVVVIVVGLIVAVLAHLVGRPRWLTGSYRWAREQAGRPDTTTRIAESADGLRLAVIAIGVLALFLTGIHVLAMLVIGGLVAVALWAIEGVRRSVAPAHPVDGSDSDHETVGSA